MITPKSWMTALLLVVVVATPLLADQAQDQPVDPLSTARMYREQARKLGAKGTLPAAWSTFDKQFEEAEKAAPNPEAVATLETAARSLAARAAFLRDVKDSREPLENLLGRYDRALMELATVMGVDLDPTLTGDTAAARLQALLAAVRLERQVEVDSLRVENRRLSELAVGHVAAQDAIITQLKVELSSVRQKLWETELRAGVAEADRSAAESALTARQQREAQIKQIKTDLGDDAGEVLVRADGAIVIQVPGLDFQVGKAHLAEGQARLMDLLAEIVGRFPDAAVRIEGHTDDTGSRASNLTLSQRRAATVAGGIERRLGLAEGTLEVVGFGPDRPVAPNSTAEGRAMNRRIDVVITPAS
ncbi:MAG: OmpA family protein [Candidatus Krumholzibacteriia bacterium]